MTPNLITDPERATIAADPESDSPERGSSVVLELNRSECLRSLAANGFGRLAVNLGPGAPIIRPVNYVFDEPSQSVVFRTMGGSKFHALLRSANAAFEVDGLDPTTCAGWSVIVVGVTEEITNPRELRRLETIGLEPWAFGGDPHWVRIRTGTISGRRISRSAAGMDRQGEDSAS